MSMSPMVQQMAPRMPAIPASRTPPCGVVISRSERSAKGHQASPETRGGRVLLAAPGELPAQNLEERVEAAHRATGLVDERVPSSRVQAQLVERVEQMRAVGGSIQVGGVAQERRPRCPSQ